MSVQYNPKNDLLWVIVIHLHDDAIQLFVMLFSQFKAPRNYHLTQKRTVGQAIIPSTVWIGYVDRYTWLFMQLVGN